MEIIEKCIQKSNFYKKKSFKYSIQIFIIGMSNSNLISKSYFQYFLKKICDEKKILIYLMSGMPKI